MGIKTKTQSVERKEVSEREPYEKPEIIYEGLITTAAGSTIPDSDPNSAGSDPANIFQSTGG